jgi:hypothetical protein
VIGTISTNGTGGPWAGGAERAFEPADVTAIGKLRRGGDNRIYLVVRLVDGTEVFVNAAKQSAAEGSWLYKAGKGLLPGDEVVAWKDVQP